MCPETKSGNVLEYQLRNRQTVLRLLKKKRGKEMNRLISKISALLMSALVLLSAFQPIAVNADQEDFDEFLKNKWVEMMEKDYTSMHFSVKDYRKMGLEKPEVTLGHISYEEYAKELEEAKKSLEELHAYDFASLNERQQYDYRVYEQNLEDDIATLSYPDYQEMFNPYSGSQSNLTTLLTEFMFYEKEDIDDYLTLVADYPRYMDEMLAFTKEQAAKGYFMTDRALDKEISALNDLSGKGEEAPFIVIFNGRVDAFEGLSDEERQAYKEKNHDIVINQVFPCVDKTAEELETLRGSRSIGDKSLYAYPDGQEYYKGLLKKKISDDASAKETFDYLSKSIKDCYNYVMDLILSGNSEDLQEVISSMKEPTEMLDYLKDHLEGFPAGPELSYNASYLDPSVANPSVMAYYLTTPIDDVTDNVIRVNGTSISDEDMNTLYYTLAHEGFPGHCYQFTWYYSQPDINPLRHDLSTIGYTEGWAQYVEKIMLNRSPLNQTAGEYTAMNTFLGYTMQAAADVAVNGLGYDADKLTKWLDGMGISGVDIQPVYEAVVDSPGQIMPYGFGIAKFWELRERTQSALGEEFDMEEYHYQILNNGPRSFDIVENDLKAYVEGKGKTLPEDFTFFNSERTEGMLSIGGTINTAYKYRYVIIAGIVIVAILILVVIFLILRAIFRAIFEKRK